MGIWHCSLGDEFRIVRLCTSSNQVHLTSHPQEIYHRSLFWQNKIFIYFCQHNCESKQMTFWKCVFLLNLAIYINFLFVRYFTPNVLKCFIQHVQMSVKMLNVKKRWRIALDSISLITRRYGLWTCRTYPLNCTNFIWKKHINIWLCMLFRIFVEELSGII